VCGVCLVFVMFVWLRVMCVIFVRCVCEFCVVVCVMFVWSVWCLFGFCDVCVVAWYVCVVFF